MSGTIGNADTWRVVFKNAAGAATAPDGSVTWTVTTPTSTTTTVQTGGQAVATGTFELNVVPAAMGEYTVKAAAVMGGVAQATAAELRQVTR